MESENHVACHEAYRCVGVGVAVVKELLDLCLQRLCCLLLLASDGAQRLGHGGVSCPGAPGKTANDLLNAADPFLGQGAGGVVQG